MGESYAGPRPRSIAVEDRGCKIGEPKTDVGMNSRYATRMLLTMLAMVIPVATSAQSIAGRIVLDIGHWPLRNAAVELMADGSAKWVDSTTTDTTGVFYLNALHDGQYYVQIIAPRFNEVLLKTPALLLSSSEDVQREFVVPFYSLVVTEKQAETPARYKLNPPIPKYPRELEASGLEGSVVAQLVVDTTGRVAPGSFRILRSSHPDFSQAVRDVVFKMLFEPARIRGRPVRQLVEQRFEFAMPNR
jgi:TonB family protein